MRAYQIIGLLVVIGALTFVAGMKFGEKRTMDRIATNTLDADDCCGPVAPGGVQTLESPPIPPASGLPSLLAFGSGECGECRKVDTLLEELAPELEGNVEVIHLDPDVYPQEATRWAIRIIPTQILVDTGGNEVSRQEGFIPREELLESLASVGMDVGGQAAG